MNPASKWFQASLTISGSRHYVGTWLDEREAAIARDRVVLHFDLDVPLNLPREAKRRGPASPAEMRRTARERSKAEIRTSRFFGVYRRAERSRWVAAIATGGNGWVPIASFLDESLAARAYDRVAVAMFGRSAQLNFPELRPRPATIEEIRREARASVKAAKMTSIYRGVSRVTDAARWLVQICVDRTRYTVGVFESEKEAARAYDRVALWLLGPDAECNFPESRLSPCSPEAVREEQRAARKEKATSRYRGVMWYAGYQRWAASAPQGGNPNFLGYFDDEEEAAEAHDRAMRKMGADKSKLNFPNKKLRPATPKQIRDERWACFKETTTSRFTGVSWSEASRKWLVQITVEGEKRTVGYFTDEEDAARAYDRSALRLRGAEGRLNFPG